MHNKVLTIDGPSGVGKGSVARIIAAEKKWSLLDSGAIYRALAFCAQNNNIALDDEEALSSLALKLDLSFYSQPKQELLSIYLDKKEVSLELRTQNCAKAASQVAKIASVRQALLARQRNFDDKNGLVADGRDMGTMVFPNAKTKVFLTATAKKRAKRRLIQLQKSNKISKMFYFLSDEEFSQKFKEQLLIIEKEIIIRDGLDMNRKNSPLKPAQNATIIDTSNLNIEQVTTKILALM